MNESDFDKTELFLYAYRQGWKLGGRCPEMIGLVIRNRVKAGWGGPTGYGYLGVIQDAPRVAYNDGHPGTEGFPDFRDHAVKKLLMKTDAIYDRRVADEGLASVLVNDRLTPALYWCDISDLEHTRPWWTEKFSGKRPLISAGNLWLYE